MFDTWAKVSSGLLQGNRLNFGFYTACVNFHFKSENSLTIRGQHCMVEYQAKVNSSFGASNEFAFNWREV